MGKVFVCVARVVAAVLGAAAFSLLLRSLTKKDLGAGPEVRSQERARILVKRVQRISTGMAEDEVARILGVADAIAGREWLYFLDDHSGYAIDFDDTKRVETVGAWKS